MPSLESTTPTAAQKHTERAGDETPLTQTECAKRRTKSVRTLERERAEGRGPPYFLDGLQIRYWWSEYVAWTASRARGGDRATTGPPRRRGRPRKHDQHREGAGA